MKFPKSISIHILGMLFCTITLWSTGISASDLRLDPQHVKGADACGECHKTSVQAWKGSHHSTTFKDMPRSQAAADIAKNMGIKLVILGEHLDVLILDHEVRSLSDDVFLLLDFL